MLEPFSSEFTPYLEYLSKTANFILKLIKLIPGSDILIRYVKSSHQNDLSVPYSNSPSSSLSFEIDELIAEWKPEPLRHPNRRYRGIPTARAKILHGEAAKRFIENPSHDSPIDPNDIIEVTNLASINFAGLIGHEESSVGLSSNSVEVGSVVVVLLVFTAPLNEILPIFWAFKLDHLRSGFSTTFIGNPFVQQRGDIIVVDRGVNFSIQKGIQISRSTIRWFDHNDMGSLEKVLEQLQYEEIKYRRKLTRKFIITEALFESDGQICDLPAIIELKGEIQFRLIPMRHGRLAVWENWARFDGILWGTVSTQAEDFVRGRTRLSLTNGSTRPPSLLGALPPLLATAASESIKILREGDGVDRFEKLRKNIKIFRETQADHGDPMSDDDD
ncbi:hypothetical protein H4Q26_006663 [Puccinia striiformis f. sp. tritici PST-130]|nr:hypothetical protein H4Q26_006663 [Puccinia striiformis f. sp. tritici PST-130]